MPATQPTKEQVRAYLHARAHLRESAGSPPPEPEEIRQLLGWHYCATEHAPAVTATAPALLLPGTLVQLGALLTVEWCFRAAGAMRRM